MPLLGDAEIRAGLSELPEWEREGDAIRKNYEFGDFMAAIDFVNRVAELAEEKGHHPDITINYNNVTLLLSTHDAGGITEKDLEAAKAFEGVAG